MGELIDATTSSSSPPGLPSSQALIAQDAETVYEYHRMHMSLPRSVDAIFCLCSLDLRVAERAAELFLAGYGDYLIFSGGSGKLTQDRFSKPEAEVFADKAREMGVAADKLVIEPNSTNTGENVRFTFSLLEGRNLHPRSFILVQKPYMERRTYATFKKQWPDLQTDISVTSPELAWEEYPDEDNAEGFVISIMVGDLIRLRTYAEKGFQIPQDIPTEVWEAGQRLVKAGFDHHLPA